MRTIKFRAWTGASMEYRVMAGYLGAFYVEGLDPKDTACMSPFNTKYESAPVMQFTGLLDKNGKEIYEGDIVSLSKYSMQRWPVPVHFVEYGFFAGNYSLWMYRDCIEVIGNIHENPELLSGPTECALCGRPAVSTEHCPYFADEDNPNQPHLPVKVGTSSSIAS